MNNNIQIKIDEVIQEISQLNDLNIKVDTLKYMEQQASFMLWQLEEDLRVDQNMKNI
ncbi:MAG: hypothetical protein MJZ76_01515 [Bacteroidales bacterium]|nr:hypothetical protein [Bacteroidales bacterium]